MPLSLASLEPPAPEAAQPEAPEVNELKVLDHTGDSKMEWNPRNPDEVEAARAHFDKLKKKGYLAYRVDPVDGGQVGEAIRDFDPQARTIIMNPPMAGG